MEVMTKDQFMRFANDLKFVAREHITVLAHKLDSSISVIGSELAILRIYKVYHQTRKLHTGKCAQGEKFYITIELGNFVIKGDYKIELYQQTRCKMS